MFFNRQMVKSFNYFHLIIIVVVVFFNDPSQCDFIFVYPTWTGSFYLPVENFVNSRVDNAN